MSSILACDIRHQAGELENPSPGFHNRNALAPELQRRRTPIQDVLPPPVELAPYQNRFGFFCLPERFRHLKLSAADWSVAALMGSKLSIIGHPCMWAEGRTLKDLALAIARELKLGRSTVEQALKKFRKAGAVSWRQVFWRDKDHVYLDFAWALRLHTRLGEPHQPAQGLVVPGRPAGGEADLFPAEPTQDPAPDPGSCAAEGREPAAATQDPAHGAGSGAMRKNLGRDDPPSAPPAPPDPENCATQVVTYTPVVDDPPSSEAPDVAAPYVYVNSSKEEITYTSGAAVAAGLTLPGLGPEQRQRFHKLMQQAPAPALDGARSSKPTAAPSVAAPIPAPPARPEVPASPASARPIDLAKLPESWRSLEADLDRIEGSRDELGQLTLGPRLIEATGDDPTKLISVNFHRLYLRLLAEGKLGVRQVLREEMAAFRAGTDKRLALQRFARTVKRRLIALGHVDPNPNARASRPKKSRPEQYTPSAFASGLLANMAGG